MRACMEATDTLSAEGRVVMADCEKCALKCTDEIKIAKHHKGRISMGNCVDFTPKQTNADRIRAMSDEELAEHFSELIRDTREQEYCVGVDDWLKWLQSEVEG